MNHNEIYHEGYFKNHYDISFKENRLRLGDQFMAICYSFNINILEVFSNPEFEHLTHRDFCWDNNHGKLMFKRQINFIINQFKENSYLRMPNSILEIGSGRGEVIAVLKFLNKNIAGLNYNIQAIDPAPDFLKLYKETCDRLFHQFLEQSLIQSSLNDSLNLINYDNIDTVILSESLEHLEKEEFFKFLNYALPYFRKNKTRLIIVNAWGYWPIEANGHDHVWEINDEVYDHIQSLARLTVVRSRSHLVIDF